MIHHVWIMKQCPTLRNYAYNTACPIRFVALTVLWTHSNDILQIKRLFSRTWNFFLNIGQCSPKPHWNFISSMEISNSFNYLKESHTILKVLRIFYRTFKKYHIPFTYGFLLELHVIHLTTKGHSSSGQNWM